MSDENSRSDFESVDNVTDEDRQTMQSWFHGYIQESDDSGGADSSSEESFETTSSEENSEELVLPPRQQLPPRHAIRLDMLDNVSEFVPASTSEEVTGDEQDWRPPSRRPRGCALERGTASPPARAAFLDTPSTSRMPPPRRPRGRALERTSPSASPPARRARRDSPSLSSCSSQMAAPTHRASRAPPTRQDQISPPDVVDDDAASPSFLLRRPSHWHFAAPWDESLFMPSFKIPDSFESEPFVPDGNCGSRNHSLTAEASPLKWFALFWGHSVWKRLVDMTNRHAYFLNYLKPDYIAAKTIVKKPVSMTEMKAMFAIRIGMETAVHKTTLNS